MVASILVTQVGVEALNQGTTKALVTSVDAEVAVRHPAAVLVTEVAIEVLRSVILPPPLDGSAIKEWTAGEMAATGYGESDYDSIWSRGDRVANGLMTVGFYGFASMVNAVAQSFDDDYSNGAKPTGDTSAPFYEAGACAVWWNTGAWPLILTGVQWIGTETIADDGSVWSIMGGLGLGGVYAQSYAFEFDSFPIQQPATPLDPVYGMKQRVLEFTPRLSIAYPHYELRFMVSASYAGSRLSNEFHLRIAHSPLDGGDRRLTNTRPDKRVTFSMSADWSFEIGTNIIDPANALFDGIYASPSPVAPTQCSKLRAAGGASPHVQSTAGAWLQFTFPRKVRMNHVLFQIASGDQESYTGANPNHYGTWHWEATNGTVFAQVGSSWSFAAGCAYMVAPRVAGPGFGLPSDAVYTQWRMVLETGPAFGTDQLLAQVMFNVDDPDMQSVAFSIGFTDDNAADSNPLPVATIGSPGSPYVVAFTDGDTDKLTINFSNIPNPLLSVDFTDGDTDRLEIFSELFPSTVTQTFVKTNGRR